MGTSYHLPRLVGASRSAELLLTGRVFDAAEAKEMGLVFEIVPFEQVVDRSIVKARETTANPPLAVWIIKETMWQTVDAPSLRHAMDIENRTQVMCTATGELADSFQAFREGRLGVMEYYNLRNLQSDTEMRNSIAGSGTGAGTGGNVRLERNADNRNPGA